MTKNLERSHPPQLTLVGAGPGAIDLITVRGLNALKSANVVLYDALVDKELLDFAPQATHIFVGKRKGFKRYSQEEINEMIVSYALTHGHVVRLKGGDSFIFGRGAEEIEFCRLFNLKIDVIPGISSSLAAPALAGISVTQRNLARSFWVLTGTASEGKLNNDIKLAAQSSATVVILMGMSKLPQIVEIFKNQDKENLPVSIIQNASKSNQKIGTGTVSTICEVVKQNQLKNPAVIVLGETVSHSHRIKEIIDSSFENLGTHGRA